MTIASQLQDYADGLEDAYDAVNDMQGTIPQDRNMDNLDAAIRTIPQSQGATYTAGNGINIDANNEISAVPVIIYWNGNAIVDGDNNVLTYAQVRALYDANGNSVVLHTFSGNTPILALDDANRMIITMLDTDVEGPVLQSYYYYYDEEDDDYYWMEGLPQKLQPFLQAGSNIQINHYTNTISATDTTYSAFTGATTQQAGAAGLVPAPTTSDPDKFLKGDGTWATVPSGGTTTTFHWGGSPTASMYADSSFTTPVSASEIKTAFEDGGAIISDHTEYVEYVVTSCDGTFCEAVGRRTVPSAAIVEQHFSYMSATWTKTTTEIQPKLTAGTGINISAQNVISATGGNAATIFYYDDVTEDLYKDNLYTTQATFSDVTTAYNSGAVIIKDMTYETAYASNGISVVAVDNIQSVFCMMQSSGTQYYVVYSYTPGGTPVWSHGVTELQKKLTAGSNISFVGNTISATDTTYSNFTGATSSVAGAAGLVPAPAAGDEGKALHGDGTWKDTTAKLVEMSYGEASAWAKFIAAYNAGSIVYCRASSNANPASGSQTRKAFMAYVNNAASPTSVEFQYVRSVSSKTEAQPVDQVFVYTLTNASGGTWSVASRNMAPKIAAGTGINVSYSNGTYTISLA